MALCHACGQETQWVEVDGERVALNRRPDFSGTYVLDPEDNSKAMRAETPGRLGYERHDETCPMRVRDREKRERKL